MDKEYSFTRLLNEKRIMPASEAREEYEFDRFDEMYPLLVIEDATIFCATPDFRMEIYESLSKYITNEIDWGRSKFEDELKKRQEFVFPDRDSLRAFYDKEREILVQKLWHTSEFGLPTDLHHLARSFIYQFISSHFKEWITHWSESGRMDFQYYNKSGSDEFQKAIQVISIIDCNEHVLDKTEALYSGNPKETDLLPQSTEKNGKLLWLASPAHLAFIVDLLIEKNYLKKPTPFGERSAAILLNYFDFQDFSPSKESLGKLLHKDKYPINDLTVIDRFRRIPDRNELKK